MDSNLITEAPFSESVAVQTTIRTPKDARNNNIVANRITRWTAGERMSLWLEGMKMTKADQPPRKARKRPQTATDYEAEDERGQVRKRREVISLARRGLPGKAVQHASSTGLAPLHSCNGSDDEIKVCGASAITKHVTARDGANLK